MLTLATPNAVRGSIVAAALLGVGREPDGERGDPDDRGHDRGDRRRRPGALPRGVAGRQPQGQRQPGGEPADLADQPRREGDRAEDDDDRADGDVELAARPGAAGQVGAAPAPIRTTPSTGQPRPAAHRPPAPGEHRGHVGARGLHCGGEGRDHGCGPADDQGQRQLGPAPVERPETGAEMLGDRHGDSGQRNAEQRSGGGRSDADHGGLREHGAADVPRRTAGCREQGQVALSAADSDGERRPGQQHDLDDDRDDDEHQDSLGGRVDGRGWACASDADEEPAGGGRPTGTGRAGRSGSAAAPRPR